MSTPSLSYIDAKARVVRAINRVTTFVKASADYNNDKTNVAKRAKIRNMLKDLHEIRHNVENDIQIMETAVGSKTAPSDVVDNQCSSSLVDSFDTLFYELAAFADVHSFPVTTNSDLSSFNTTTVSQSHNFNNLSMFQLPKRKFPTFSGNIVEWQGFEDLFQSILSHAPDLPDVERFEYLKTSLTGEALSLVSHLALTSANYKSAWELLRLRYGNKRDLARIHLDELLKPRVIKWDNSSSIKTSINTILEHTSALDNLEFVTRQWSPILLHIFESHLDYELRARWEQLVGDKHNPQLSEYVEFMQDYLTSGHMELVPPNTLETAHKYYIPHHCVVKPDSTTTKLRVVFNASTQTANGISLNESLYVGPKLQPDIQIVLLRARLWKYVFAADIKQMYRQILIHPDDRDYQRILWRFSSSTPIEEYRLCTVTYGTSAAPFQALRTIRELAMTDGVSLPRAATIMLNDTFVDDVLSGADSISEALECQQQLIQLCSGAQFDLRKWASNCIELLHAVSEDSRAMAPSVLLDASENPDLKILGLKWDPSSDTLSFKTRLTTKNPTKRSILSDIARVYDPLGLLSPITLWTKHIMQRLWTDGVGWDDPVSTEIALEWSRYESELPMIANLFIRRRLTYDDAVSLQLHAFSDSSTKGYAAAVYLRVETQTLIHCQLIAGKSKVAPLKRCTIPRLELCGAVLAAKLLNFVISVYADRLQIDELHAWTDSTTALIWIQSSPHRWATFIANRTSQIQELTSPLIWRYVPTQHNPVDCASRGLFPSELVYHPLWWTGPSFLTQSSENWPELPNLQKDNLNTVPDLEMKKSPVLLVSLNSSLSDIIDRFSSLDKIIRIISYCFRFCKVRTTIYTSTTITAKERSRALNALIYFAQQKFYCEDIKRLQKGLRCSKELRRLNPFLDEIGLVRVGGRLTNSDLPYAQKHPVLMPSSHRLTNLLIHYHHIRLKHPGAYALQSYLQQEYWIQSARRVIRSCLRLCVSCFRARPKCIEPKMASLPKFRVQQIKPFSVCGVDYAGPITIKRSRGRSSNSTSVYICLFVCMATKALHLELSSDLSTETFLLAFTRFAARRGPIREVHSDCGTNFVGASRALSPLETLTQSKGFQDRVHNQLAKEHITWQFNPPSSPHFGGLWEAGVKSTKSLILRSIGAHRLTNEELMTLLTQIEATLNSRPLGAVSNDPSDLTALTPNHFLTLEPSTTIPEPDLKTLPLSKLQRWRLIADLHNHFWTRWKTDYLSSLQIRNKWTEHQNQLTLGGLVLIKEASHPLDWRLGRIVKLHPGSDGISRVATVRTASGIFVRPAVKLCPFPSC